MSAAIEALYIYDEYNEPVLEHIYSSRPPLAKQLLSQFLAHPSPRPSVLYLTDTLSPTLVYSVFHAPLLLLCPSSSNAQPFAVLEFIYRVIDIFEDFLGAPLLAEKVTSNYDVVAQLLNEMCDGGMICNTEPNALRENIAISGLIGKLFSQVGLPGSSAALSSSSNLASKLQPAPAPSSGPAIPWRRSNVRHTSNELYVDIVESLSVILAPSGRPISAIAAGSIAFTAKISGVPELILVLSAPGGTSASKSSGIARTMQLPVFHPCVRIAWWKDHPGELSFVPPDGRFVLAGYEVDLLPTSPETDALPSSTEKLFLPATVDIHTGLGVSGNEFEVRLTLNTSFPGVPSVSKIGPSSSRPGIPSTTFSFGGSSGGSSSAPSLEGVVVTIPLPEGVRNVTELKCSRGDATYSQWNSTIEWKVTIKDGASINGTASLAGTIIGPISSTDADDEENDTSLRSKTNPLLGYYDEESAVAADPYQSVASEAVHNGSVSSPATSFTPTIAQQRRVDANKILMPSSAAVSFTVKGWLLSGIKVDGLHIDTRRSRGMGEGVKPYKGVKYVTVSKKGIEWRV